MEIPFRNILIVKAVKASKPYFHQRGWRIGISPTNAEATNHPHNIGRVRRADTSRTSPAAYQGGLEREKAMAIEHQRGEINLIGTF
jgi:hypothetical protein